MDGSEFVQALHKKDPNRNIGRIMMTAGVPDPETVGIVDDILKKPFDLDEMSRLVRRFYRPTLPQFGMEADSRFRLSQG